MDAAEYLADILARCAFMEENFHTRQYTDHDTITTDSILRLYVAVLRYSAEASPDEKSNVARATVASFIEIIEQKLTKLRSAVQDEELHLKQWLVLNEHLHRRDEAERILAQIDQILEAIQSFARDVELAKLPCVGSAFYDSFSSREEDRCLPRTRTDLLKRLMVWAKSPSQPGILWLRGKAGTGKSTVSRSLAAELDTQGILGASFLFNRGEARRGNASKIIPTIVRQLAAKLPQLIPGVKKAVGSDPLWLLRSPENNHQAAS
jgi:hypothetical protein